MKKNTYIIPKTSTIQVRLSSPLLSSGAFTFTIPGVLIDYDNGGGDLGSGV